MSEIGTVWPPAKSKRVCAWGRVGSGNENGTLNSTPLISRAAITNHPDFAISEILVACLRKTTAPNFSDIKNTIIFLHHTINSKHKMAHPEFKLFVNGVEMGVYDIMDAPEPPAKHSTRANEAWKLLPFVVCFLWLIL